MSNSERLKIETEIGEERAPEILEPKEVLEILSKAEVRTEKSAEELKRELETVYEEETEKPKDTPEDIWRRCVKYREKYLPDYLKKSPSIVSRAIGAILELIEGSDIEGDENIPEGGCLVVCNHFGGGRMGMGDTESLMTAFKEKNIHIGIGKNIWWNKSPILKWIFKKMGGIPIDESLANLTKEQKQEVLERQTEKSKKKIYGDIIEKEKRGRSATNIEFIRQSVAAISRGDAVSIYPEGLWLNPESPLRERQELKQGYRGLELIAREYKKVTGKELKIVPTAFVEDREIGSRKFVIGEPLILENNDSRLNGADWVMAHVAQMLPEEQRGYYKESVEKLEQK